MQSGASHTTCLTCGYELEGLFKPDGRVMCPECGRTFSAAQLKTIHENKFYWGPFRWVLPLGVVIAFVLRSGLSSKTNAQASTSTSSLLVFVWIWACVFVLIEQNSRTRLSGFAAIAGLCVGFIAAAIATALLVGCASMF
ncbi:MAG: hypothetical protein U0640_03575 [Phycisphaerales bacterium]